MVCVTDVALQITGMRITLAHGKEKPNKSLPQNTEHTHVSTQNIHVLSRSNKELSTDKTNFIPFRKYFKIHLIGEKTIFKYKKKNRKKASGVCIN